MTLEESDPTLLPQKTNILNIESFLPEYQRSTREGLFAIQSVYCSNKPLILEWKARIFTEPLTKTDLSLVIIIYM